MKSISIIGCGFVADYYMLTLSKSKTLKVAGVFDSIRERAVKLAERYSIPKVYDSLEALLGDDAVEIVINLTNPRKHYETTMACLEAGKHVYSEKPMAMTVEAAKKLVEVAEHKSLRISTAPCSLLGEAAQTIWKAVRENAIGKVRLVYAELDEDLVHKVHAGYLRNSVGLAWPAKDEFEVGVTLEHAGYYLAWLAACFGPAQTVTAFGSCLIPDKMTEPPLDPPDTPDFTVACVEFQSGTVARVTCGIVAPHDHSLTMIGDTGILHVKEAWNYGSPVHIRPREWNRDSLRSPVERFAVRVRRKLVKHFEFFEVLERLGNPHGRRYRLVRAVPEFEWPTVLRMDFSRGVQELADAIDEKRESRLSTRFSLHITELALAIHQARSLSLPYRMTTTFEPVEPMPWAK
jgi:predicted dehydrogenase